MVREGVKTQQCYSVQICGVTSRKATELQSHSRKQNPHTNINMGLVFPGDKELCGVV